MPSPRIIRFTPRPLSGTHAACEHDTPATVVRLGRSPAADRVSEMPLWMRLLIIAAVLAAILSCSPSPRPPLPGAELPGELQRIDDAICAHELAVCRWRCAQ